MVVHEYEMATDKTCGHEAKKFIIVQNHVREIISPDKTESNGTNVSSQTTEDISQRIQKKSSRNLKKRRTPSISLDVNADSIHNKPTEISLGDLEELRSVYNKCKEVIMKIETKYGDLLNINRETNSDSLKKGSNSSVEEECHCSKKKKIIFKDNGEQEVIDTDNQGHICPKKFKRSHVENTQSISRNIEIQYSENEIQLPDNLDTLSNMLKNPELEITYRNKIIDKVRLIKQELHNEIRFNKHVLIEKLKANPYELLGFEGTNLASLPGYS